MKEHWDKVYIRASQISDAIFEKFPPNVEDKGDYALTINSMVTLTCVLLFRDPPALTFNSVLHTMLEVHERVSASNSASLLKDVIAALSAHQMKNALADMDLTDVPQH